MSGYLTPDYGVKNPCAGVSPFHIETMRAMCRLCNDEKQHECRVSAANAPFPLLEPQVWGGLLLPAERDQLPAPHTAATYPTVKRGRGRPAWYAGAGRNYSPQRARVR